MWRSCSTTRATRRSRKVCEARSTAAAAAFSHDSLLVPTRSITLYTLSAMLRSFRSVITCEQPLDSLLASGYRHTIAAVIRCHNYKNIYLTNTIPVLGNTTSYILHDRDQICI